MSHHEGGHDEKKKKTALGIAGAFAAIAAFFTFKKLKKGRKGKDDEKKLEHEPYE